MSLQETLLMMLRDVFDVERASADGFIVRPVGTAPIRLIAIVLR